MECFGGGVRYVGGYAVLRGKETVYAHIVAAERALGKPLPKGAEVHHVDEDKTNYVPGNLVVCPTHAYHRLLHTRQRVMDAGGDPDKQKFCAACKRLLEVSAFVKSVIRYDGLHNQCRQCDREYKKRAGKNIGKWDARANELQNQRRARDKAIN